MVYIDNKLKDLRWNNSKGFFDTKKFRRDILVKSNERLGVISNISKLFSKGVVSENTIKISNHGLLSGDKVRLNKGYLSGLEEFKDYYIITLDIDNVSFSETKENSLIGKAISIKDDYELELLVYKYLESGSILNKNSGMSSLLDSSYKSEVPSTNYSMHLKSIAFESARLLILAEEARNDLYFEETRGEYFSQNIASFLFPNGRFPTTDRTDEESRTFYKAIIESYFGGSTKKNIEKSLYNITKGILVNVNEKYKNSSDPIVNKFTFDIVLSADENIKQSVHGASINNVPLSGIYPLSIDGQSIEDGQRVLLKNQTSLKENGIYTLNVAGDSYSLVRSEDVNTWNEIVGAIVSVDTGELNLGTKWINTNSSEGILGKSSITFSPYKTNITDIDKTKKDVEFLVDIIKPAHTLYTTKILYSEKVDSVKKIQEDTSLDLFDYYYEDTRKKCGVVNVLRVEKELVQKEDVHKEFSYFQASPRVPISNEGGNWSNTDSREFHTKKGPFANSLGELANSVNDITVYVDNIPVRVSKIYPLSASFKLEQEYPVGSEIRVTYSYLKNYTGSLITNNLDSVINNFNNNATEHSYSTVLFPNNFKPIKNEEEFLNLKESFRYKGIDLFNSAVLNSPISLNLNEPDSRSRLNDYTLFKSYGYDLNKYSIELNEGVPLFPKSLELDNEWRRLKDQEFILNNQEFSLNTREDRLFGVIHKESYFPFFSSLEFEVSGNGGQRGFLKSICEDDNEGLRISFSRTIEESIPKIKPELEEPLDVSPLNTFYEYFPETASSNINKNLINSENYLIMEGGVNWGISNSPTKDYLNNDLTASSYPVSASISYSFSGNSTQTKLLINDVHRDYFSKISIKDNAPDIAREADLSSPYYLPYNNGFFMNYDIRTLDKAFRVRDISNQFRLVFRTNYPILLSKTDPTNIYSLSESSITRVKNITKDLDYDLTNTRVLGDKIIEIDKDNPTNISIGYDIGDEIGVDYISICKMNDNYELTTQLISNMEYKLITNYPIEELTRVFNQNKIQFYSIENIKMYGDKIVRLDNDNLINKLIGFNLSDIIRVTYTSPILNERVVYGTSLYGNFLKIRVNTNYDIAKLISVKNVTRNKFYDLIGYVKLDRNTILLDGYSYHNILIGQDFSDILEIKFVEKSGVNIISDEVVEVVYTPDRFRFYGNKKTKELISVTNVSKQKKYNISKKVDVYASSGDSNSNNILVVGNDSSDYKNTKKRWVSVNSNDNITERLFLKMQEPMTIDHVVLVEHNWKKYDIFLFDKEENIISDITISVENNIMPITSHSFNEKEVGAILILAHNSIESNKEKYLYKIIYQLEDIIELDNSSVENQKIGLDYSDIVYTNSITKNNVSDIEPWLTYPRYHPNGIPDTEMDYSRSVFEMYVV